MLQTTLSVPLDVKPESAERLSSLIDAFRQVEDTGKDPSSVNFGRLIEGIPTLHFMSISVFEDPAYDPIFILEINCDGPPGPFWKQLEALAGSELREMLRCCKEPLDRNAKLYRDVTADGLTAPIAPYLQAMTQPPSVFHHGNRGLRRHRILAEATLFRDVRAELDKKQDNSYFGLSAQDIHKALRERLLETYPWLDEDPEPRISRKERILDIARVVAFAAAVLIVLSLPGILAALLLPTGIYIAAVIVLFVVISVLLYRMHEPLPTTEVTTNFKLMSALTRQIPALFLVFSYPIVFAVLWLLQLGLGFIFGTGQTWVPQVTGIIMLGNLGLFVVLPGLVLWLRTLELRDSSQYKASIDPEKVAEILRHEDWISQNHMGSIVHIRPGVLRTLVARLGHRGLGLLLRVKATEGYLGSMRTVHFAHWAFLNNHSRLLFFSNFDQSWGSYLDDFIEKAHVGLTLAWGCGVGFPPTRFLIYDGASHGRLFKNWALASRTVSRFWVSAYPDLSVDQIERNFRVARGLRKAKLSAEEAKDWARDL
ncbi:hypothetical protein [Roseovarius aestuariivivens]|uniref:hypothetical protein n=1 Tax=Roseovarius aestuariivivens TaxID=1888910 RepID=UPI0010806B04|nr:hypothetical protein [Roseovarius aestuariivivens]